MQSVQNQPVKLARKIDPDLAALYERIAEFPSRKWCIRLFEEYLRGKLKFSSSPQLFQAVKSVYHNANKPSINSKT